MSLINPTHFQEVLQSQLFCLDVEFGNARGFFSASKAGINSFDTSLPTQILEYEGHITGAQLKINDTINIESEELNRSTKFIVQRDSNLFDFVSRFVVLSNDRAAKIASEKIEHHCRNLYHQHPVSSATVPIGNKGFLYFTDANTIGHPLFERVFYVRDESIEPNGMKRWIVHHRLIVKKENAELILRCCHPRFNGPVPLQTIIPQAIKKKLFRIREIRNPNFPFMAVGESPVNSNEQLVIGTRIQLIYG